MTNKVILLRSVGVVNDYAFFNGTEPRGQVWISYHASQGYRDVVGSHWTVHRKGYRTNPNGPWYYHGNKAFSPWGTRDGMTARATALEDAKAWASKRYGITDWARTPFGGWGDASFVKERLAELKRAAKENQEKETTS